MSRDYTPRRCSKRWLDGDCPAEVLAIIDTGPKNVDRFDVLFTTVDEVKYEDSPLVEKWMYGMSVTEAGGTYHFEMRTHDVAAYRYRMKNRYTKWSTLPDAVKAAVRRDLKEAAEYDAEAAAEAAAK